MLHELCIHSSLNDEHDNLACSTVLLRPIDAVLMQKVVTDLEGLDALEIGHEVCSVNYSDAGIKGSQILQGRDVCMLFSLELHPKSLGHLQSRRGFVVS